METDVQHIPADEAELTPRMEGEATEPRVDRVPMVEQRPAAERRPVAEQRPAFVREPRHHKTQPPVNDVQADETYDNQYSHESGYTISNRNRLSRGMYRNARSQETKVKQELRYGQYLSVPRGSREIFGSRERQQRRTIAAIAIAVAIVAVIVLLVVFLLQ